MGFGLIMVILHQNTKKRQFCLVMCNLEFVLSCRQFPKTVKMSLPSPFCNLMIPPKRGSMCLIVPFILIMLAAKLHKHIPSSKANFLSGIYLILHHSLQISVELASDHKDFATALAQTRVAELNRTCRIVPITQPSLPQPAVVQHQTSANSVIPVKGKSLSNFCFSIILHCKVF